MTRISFRVRSVSDSDEVSECTVIQDTLKTGQIYSTVPQAQERVSERSGARERSEQYGASERVSGASERASG